MAGFPSSEYENTAAKTISSFEDTTEGTCLIGNMLLLFVRIKLFRSAQGHFAIDRGAITYSLLEYSGIVSAVV